MATEVRNDRRAFMAKEPQTIPCMIHPNFARKLDETETIKATQNNGGRFKAGYLRCAECILHKSLKDSGVPENLLRATFENFSPFDAEEVKFVQEIKFFCVNSRGFLFLLGRLGTGKSHLAVAALRTFGKGWFIKHNSLLSAHRATYHDKNAFDPIQRAKAARLFVLDDLGFSVGGRDELPLLHEVLDYRHEERLPTIITSNLLYEELAPVLGDRMRDRLRESTHRVFMFTGDSQRPEARQRYFKS